MGPRLPAPVQHYRTAAAFIVGLVLGLAARQLVTTAYAQVMDPGQQRMETNQGIAQLNAQLGEVLSLLRTGTLKVRAAETDKTSGTARTPPIVSSGPIGQPHGTPAAPSGNQGR